MKNQLKKCFNSFDSNIENLTSRKSKFAYFKAKGHTNRESAVLAGYSPKSASITACMLMKKPHTHKVIGHYMRAAAEKLNITEEFLLVRLKSLADHEDPKIAIKSITAIMQAVFPNESSVNVSINDQDEFVKSMKSRVDSLNKS